MTRTAAEKNRNPADKISSKLISINPELKSGINEQPIQNPLHNHLRLFSLTVE